MDFSTLPRPIQYSDRFRTPNAPERHCGLWVDRIGCSRQAAPEGPPDQLRILGLYGVVASESGQGRVLSQRFGEASVATGDVLLILPDDATSYGAVGKESWCQRWIVWGGPAAAALARWTGWPSLAPVVRGAADVVASAYAQLRDRMADESAEAAIERDAVLRLLTARILATARLGGLSASQRDAIHRTVAWIERELHRPIPSLELARRAGLSETHFRRLFTEQMGLPPQAYLKARRMARAKALLADGLRIRDVAQACGFGDDFYFMRVFKRMTGKTASAWRAGNAAAGIHSCLSDLPEDACSPPSRPISAGNRPSPPLNPRSRRRCPCGRGSESASPPAIPPG